MRAHPRVCTATPATDTTIVPSAFACNPPAVCTTPFINPPKLSIYRASRLNLLGLLQVLTNQIISGWDVVFRYGCRSVGAGVGAATAQSHYNRAASPYPALTVRPALHSAKLSLRSTLRREILSLHPARSGSVFRCCGWARRQLLPERCCSLLSAIPNLIKDNDMSPVFGKGKVCRYCALV